MSTVIGAFCQCRVVPVATLEDPATAPRVAKALVAGGITCVEVAFRHPAAAEAIRAMRAVVGLLVGAGTILSVDQAQEAYYAGAGFAVAPGTNDIVVQECARLGLPFIPGVATPSEIEHATTTLGLGVVKVFPAAQLGGPAFLRAVSAAYPSVGFIPTGGITADNLTQYLAVPTVIACGGSWLVRPDLIRERRYHDIEQLARSASEVIA